MAYHSLANETGGTADDRRAEADRIISMLISNRVYDALTEKESEFVQRVENNVPISPKQLFWLRDIKSKYLE